MVKYVITPHSKKWQLQTIKRNYKKVIDIIYNCKITNTKRYDILKYKIKVAAKCDKDAVEGEYAVVINNVKTCFFNIAFSDPSSKRKDTYNKILFYYILFFCSMLPFPFASSLCSCCDSNDDTYFPFY